MTVLQAAVLFAACCFVCSQTQQAGTYGLPSQFQYDTSFFRNRYLQDYPTRPLTHTLALTQPLQRTADTELLELLPPLQHVVGTRYPAVGPGKGFKFPLSQLLNPTEPPNLVH